MSLHTLCKLFGYSRQAYYKRLKVNAKKNIEVDVVLQMIRSYRKDMPRIGGYKLHDLINKSGYPISRANIFTIMRDNQLLIRRKGRTVITTNSKHWMKKFPNLIRGFNFDRPGQLWVSDITFIPIAGKYGFLSLITDVYTHQIVGHALHPTLATQGPLLALKMAINNVPAQKRQGLIHHSDRGSQYCSYDYVKTLKDNGIKISMTENGDPYENAVAERVNGILKDEWLNLEKFRTFKQAQERIAQVIHIYNTMRPHASCDMLTPEQASLRVGQLKKRWKKRKMPKKKPNFVEQVVNP